MKRYFVVGGAGSLEVAPGVRLHRHARISGRLQGRGEQGREFLELLRNTAGDLDWTFLSPAAVFIPGERTGKFRLGKDQLLTNDKGSSISFEDYAIAAVDESRSRRTSASGSRSAIDARPSGGRAVPCPVSFSYACLTIDRTRRRAHGPSPAARGETNGGHQSGAAVHLR